MARFIIENATFSNLEQRQGASGFSYNLAHFTISEQGRDGNTFVKQTSALVDKNLAGTLIPGTVYNFKGPVTVNKNAFLSLKLTTADVVQQAPASQPMQQGAAQPVQAQPIAQPVQAQPIAQPMPAAVQPQAAQQPAAQQPSDDLDEDIPF